MAITFTELATAILTDNTMRVTIVFYPDGQMRDLHYGELELDDVIRWTAEGHRIFTIDVAGETVNRVDLEKTKTNILAEAAAANQG